METKDILKRLQEFTEMKDYAENGGYDLVREVCAHGMNPLLLVRMLEQAHRNGERSAALYLANKAQRYAKDINALNVINLD